MSGISSPNDLHDVQNTRPDESKFTITEFVNNLDDTLDESSFQIPELEAAINPILGSDLPESNNIPNDQEINTQLNTLQSDAGTTAEDSKVDWDKIIIEPELNFNGNSEIGTLSPRDPFSVYLDDGTPAIDNPDNPNSSWVEPQNQTSEDLGTLHPLNDGDSNNVLTSDAPLDHPPSEQNQPYPQTGSFPQGLEGQTIAAGLEQDFLASSQLSLQLFDKNMMDWVIVQPNPQCHSCQLMRRTIHSNGVQDTKLEVHSYGGDFHAVLQVRFCNMGNPGEQYNSSPQMTQFPRGDPDYMRHFLMQYSLLRAKEGFGIRHDCVLVSTAAGTGMSMISDPWFPGPVTSSFPQQTDVNNIRAFGNPPLNQGDATDTSPPPKRHKGSNAEKSERLAQIKLADFAEHFDIPIKEACRKLSVGNTKMKDICRHYEVPKWPFRQVKKLDDEIKKLEQTLANANGQEAENIRKEIEVKKKKRAEIFAGKIPKPGNKRKTPGTKLNRRRNQARSQNTLNQIERQKKS